MGVSEGAMNEFVAYFHGGDRARCSVIGNGVDSDKFRFSLDSRHRLRAKFGFGEADPVAPFAGSDWGRKRLDLALATVARIPELKLVVVGHDNVERCKSMVELSGCADRVTFAGFTKKFRLSILWRISFCSVRLRDIRPGGT